MSTDSENFIKTFSGVTEEYKFYNGEIILCYDVENHEYLLYENSKLTPVEGVTTICHIIDKSNALVPWAAKMVADKLFRTIPTFECPERNEKRVPEMSYENFEKLVLAAKSAHKEKLEEAANVGHIAHAWIEQEIKAKIANNNAYTNIPFYLYPENEKAASCCRAALDWMSQHNVRWICTERKVYSKEHKYAGTLDGIALVDSCDNPLCCPNSFKDRRSLIDWKSSNYLYIEYLYQTGAYQKAYIEETDELVIDRWIIRLGKEDGEFEPWHIEATDFEQDWQGFNNALDLYRTHHAVEERMKERKNFIKKEIKKQKDADKAVKLAAEKEAKAATKAQKKLDKTTKAKTLSYKLTITSNDLVDKELLDKSE